MTKQYEDIVKGIEQGTLQQPSELQQLARIVSDGQTWAVCENITNLFNQVTTAINYARNNSLLNHELVGKAVEQGTQHLQNLLTQIAEAANAAQQEQQATAPKRARKATKRS